MGRWIVGLFAVCLLFCLPQAQAGERSMTLLGAGATFPYPIYAKWAHKYEHLTGVKLNYQSIGSGGGIAQIKAKTVDFGASDAPMKYQEPPPRSKKAKKKDDLKSLGLIQFPMVVGGVVPVVNVPDIGPGQLRLSPKLLGNIFLGNIQRWDDPAIQRLNPGLRLPRRTITVVHRADGSGTTWIFTNYLCKVSDEWRRKVGTGKAVAWPCGIGGKGNEGVARYVQRVRGSIGYVEFAYALENRMTYARLQNRAGNFVEPSIDTFQAAAANADWAHAPGFYLVLTDQPGKKSWPITGASFILIYKTPRDPERTKAMLRFFDWCYRHGADMAKELHYVPIPMNVVELIERTWSREIQVDGQPLWP